MGIMKVVTPPAEPSTSTSPANIRVLSVVILVVSVISAIGAGGIILSYMLFKTLRSFRHQLILGLAISDFWMAINFLSSSAMNLSHHNIGLPPQARFCRFNGFMTQLFVIQTDYWVLLIGVCSFIILADHKPQSSWIHGHRVFLWSLPWAFPTIWAVIGLSVAGYGDIGAWCWFTSDRVRLFVNFLPRWLIIVVLLGLYTRLYFILNRAHHQFRSHDEISGSSELPPVNLGGTGGHARTFGSGRKKASRRLERLSRQMMLYPLVYMTIWILPTAVRIYQVTKNTSAPFAVRTADEACIVIQGFADAVIYGCYESSLACWRD